MDSQTQPFDPFLPPEWRWQQAREFVERAGRPFRSCPDAAVRSAQQFWQLWLNCRGEVDRRILAARMPTLSQAFAIYRDLGGVSRPALEARILANEPAESAAAKMAATATVIRAYERLFFDVRGRLQCTDYILHQVIGPRLRQGREGWDYDLVWKFFGYLGGPTVLDTIMGGCPPTTRPVSLAEAVAFLCNDAQIAVQLQTALAARALQVAEPQTAAALLRREARSQKDREDASGDSLQQHIQAMLSELPWMAGSEAEERTPPELATFDAGAAELKADELYRLASGRGVDVELEALKELKLPPPRFRSANPDLLGGENPLV